jgi:uncharacterized protein YwgA/O-acetyl-ADP-ribose deacetylase (regulator of RNase III)
MIIKVTIGDLFETDAQTLINTINTVGIMGKGIALEFKRRFPEMFEDYQRRVDQSEVRLGEPYFYPRLFPPNIVNFTTKAHWRSVSHLSDIVNGLEYLKAHYKNWGVTSLAVPPLGCGNGGLQWKVVGPILYRNLNALEIPVYLFAPYGTPPEMLSDKFLANPQESFAYNISTQLQPGWLALMEIVKRIDEYPFRWPIGRTAFQKIAYFATKAGIRTGFDYKRSSYGPFSPELKNVITTLVNNDLMQEKQVGRMFSIHVGPSFDRASKKYASNLTTWEGIIEWVVDLFLRMNTHQAEVAATVHFVTQELGEAYSEIDVLRNVMEWKQRREPAFEEAEVALAIRNLAALGWIKVHASDSLPLPKEEDILF